MNYLAHAYLSFHQPEILVGNMISDFVKGKKQLDYALTVQQGIRLHRDIDTFTDQHPATKKAKEYLKPAVGPYSGAFVDVAYDHFLALDPHHFSDHGLQLFAEEVYEQLHNRVAALPERFAGMLPYMSMQNWLYNYRYTDGIEKSFAGVVRRAQHLDSSAAVFALFLEHYDGLREQYDIFFPELHRYASAQFGNLLIQ